MAPQPAVVIIARHGPRFDAANPSWHLQTPSPYDPPLTYGGWNQSRALGVRIASLLHIREQTAEDTTSEPAQRNGIHAYDFASGVKSKVDGTEHGGRKRRKRHKVIIHTSPFLRCLQTSVAIAAGMAQFQPTDFANRAASKGRTLHSASPRLAPSPSLEPIAEPRDDLAHAIARRAIGEPRRHRKSKLRVDAFLGEWLNPQYFENITPPPPSPLMLATARRELSENEPVEVFTPTLTTKTSSSSLWSGSNGHRSDAKIISSLDDWEEVTGSLNPTIHRDRAGSVSSIDSHDSGRRSPFRGAHILQTHASLVPKSELSVYSAPSPQYAVSGTDQIPRGYVSHARQACVDVDSQWDSSRPPQDWGDGGEYGEEWSAMHKRFRKGLNHLIHWYGQHGVDDRAEDALGVEQAEKHADEEEEDLVIILVTHGAGCNALIGALTGQPVLLDVGMASLTMAERKDNAAAFPIISAGDSTSPIRVNGDSRRSSLDLGLSSMYEMKIISSSEHLRPGADPSRIPSAGSISNPTSSMRGGLHATSGYRQHHGTGPLATGGGRNSTGELDEPSAPVRSNTSSMLGSVRRPSAFSANSIRPAYPGSVLRSSTSPPVPLTGTSSAGLWAPTGSKSPFLAAKSPQHQPASSLASLDITSGREKLAVDAASDDSHKSSLSSSTFTDSPKPVGDRDSQRQLLPQQQPRAMAGALKGDFTIDGASSDALAPAEVASRPSHHSSRDQRGSLSDLSQIQPQPPQALSRALSQKGLWGSRPADIVQRAWGSEPKRRWTITKDN